MAETPPMRSKINYDSKSTKDTRYFSHDSDAASDPKVIALCKVYGDAGYGKFWRLLEYFRKQADYSFDDTPKFAYSSLAEILKFDHIDECKKFIKDLINEFDLLKQKGPLIYSESFCRRMAIMDEKRNRLSERGRAGANATNSLKSAQAKKVYGTSEDISSTGDSTSEDISGNKEINKEKKESVLVEFVNQRKPKIPTRDEVFEVFCRSITDSSKALKMANSFYDKHESAGWYMSGNRPIVNFISLVQKFINTWDEIESKNTTHDIKNNSPKLKEVV